MKPYPRPYGIPERPYQKQPYEPRIFGAPPRPPYGYDAPPLGGYDRVERPPYDRVPQFERPPQGRGYPDRQFERAQDRPFERPQERIERVDRPFDRAPLDRPPIPYYDRQPAERVLPQGYGRQERGPYERPFERQPGYERPPPDRQFERQPPPPPPEAYYQRPQVRPDGFERQPPPQGYPRPPPGGFERGGFERPPGIERPGLDRERPGFDRPPYERPPPNFERPGLERPGFERPGFERPPPQVGYERAPPGYERGGYERPPPPGYDRPPPPGYERPPPGYERNERPYTAYPQVPQLANPYRVPYQESRAYERRAYSPQAQRRQIPNDYASPQAQRIKQA